jgi:hypothetical protein
MFQAFKKVQGNRLKAATNLHDFIDVGHEVAKLVGAHVSSLYDKWFAEAYLAKAVSFIPTNDNDALDHFVEHLPQIYAVANSFKPYTTSATWNLAKMHQAVMDNWVFQKTKMPALVVAVGASDNSVDLINSYKNFHNCLVSIPLGKQDEWIVAVWPGLKQALSRIGEHIDNPADYAKLLENATIGFKGKPVDDEFFLYCQEHCQSWLEIARLLQPKYTNVTFAAYFAQ